MNELDDLKSLGVRGIEVGSGAGEVLETQVAGLIYKFPPNAVTVVGDRMEYPLDEKKINHILSAPPVVSPGWDALAVVRHILDSIRLGGKGLYVVMHDGQDDERRKKAYKQWLQWRTARAQSVQSTWVKRVEGARQTPGAPIPIMPQSVRKEMEFLRDHVHEITDIDRKRYVCVLDGADFDTLDEAVEHVSMFFAHRLKEESSKPERYIQDTEIELKQAREAGRRAAAREAAQEPFAPVALGADIEGGLALIQKAKDMGVKLTSTERKGLSDGDLGVIVDVKERLAAQETVSA